MRFDNSQRLDERLTLRFAPDAERRRIFLPVDRFCVRKAAALFAGGRHWLYADVVPWDSPHWPDTYDTSIHAFSSPDCSAWTYHGEVLRHRVPGSWDFGGVTTPGALLFDGRVHVFYTGYEKPGRGGVRQIGMAVAEKPEGPFVKATEPIISTGHPESHPCDTIPLLSHDRKGIELFYRQADHQLPPPNYRIRKTVSRDAGRTWSPPVDILVADSVIRAYEAAEAARIGGKTFLATFDHFTGGGFKVGFRVSSDGLRFLPSTDLYLDDHLCHGWPSPRCGLQPTLIPDADGAFRHIGVAVPTDADGHYNQMIMPMDLTGSAGVISQWPSVIGVEAFPLLPMTNDQ